MLELEFEPAFASCFGKRLDASMIPIVTTIQLDRLDAGSRRLFGDRLANLGRRIAVTAVVDAAAQSLVASAGTDEGLAGLVISDLATEVFQ